VRSEGRRDLRCFVRFGDQDPGIVEKHVVFVERTGILGDRIE
jgi:hypothetical protein